MAPTLPAPPGEQGIGFMSILGWGNCVCIVPEMLYWQFGRDQYIREYCDCMKAFLDCEIRKMGGLFGKKDLWIAPSLGDWLAMGRDVKYMAMHNGPVSNAFIVNDLRIMVWAARLLGIEDDAKRYADQLDATREAYLKAFVKKDGTMKDDYQGAYIMAPPPPGSGGMPCGPTVRSTRQRCRVTIWCRSTIIPSALWVSSITSIFWAFSPWRQGLRKSKSNPVSMSVLAVFPAATGRFSSAIMEQFCISAHRLKLKSYCRMEASRKLGPVTTIFP